MADDAQRGVTFTLKANVDPSAKQIMDGWFNGINSSIENLGNATSAAAASTTQSVAAATSAAQQSVAGSTATQASQIQQFFDQTNQAAQAYLDSQAKRAAQQAQHEQQLRDISQMSLQELLHEQNASTVSAFDREKQIMDDALRWEEAAMRKYFEAVDALRQKALVDADSITDQEVADVQELEREAVAAAERRSAAETRFTNAEAAERRRQVQERIEGIRETTAENERAAERARRTNEQIGTSMGRVISAFSEGSEALMRFVSGIQHLGLIGEKDLQKVQDAILRIQGTTQVFTGVIRLIRQVAEGYDAYRRSVLLTAEAHATLAAARAAEAAAAPLAGVVGRAATGGAPAGPAGAAIGGVAGGAAGSTLGTLATAGASAGVRIGTGLGAVGISTAGLEGLTILGAAGAAIAGLAVDLYAFKELLNEWKKFDFGGGATKGGFVERMGTSSLNPFAYQATYFEEIYGEDGISPGKQREQSTKKLEAAQKFQAEVLKRNAEDEKRIAELNREQAASSQMKAQTERDALSHKMAAMTIEERRTEILKQIAETEKNTSLTAEQRAKQQVQLANQRLQVEREISSEQIRSAQQTLASAKNELATKEQQIKVAQDAAMSAQERFGLLSAEEQQLLIDAKKEFQGGAQNIDVDQLRKLRGFSGALDEQIAAEARRRAQAAGFGAFQSEDLKRIQGLEQERKQLEVKVKAQADVVAKLEIDIEATAREINKQISAQFKIILESMANQISGNAIEIKKLENAMIQRFTRL